MTPACVALDVAGIEYTIHPYEHDPASESFGLEAAAALGVEPERVFKTLMAELDDGELVVAVVPVTGALDLKALARAAGRKKARMADIEHAERSSGYVAGGISPFGQRRQRRTFVDASVEARDVVYVSGGKRGLDIAVAPIDLVRLTDALVADLGAG